MSKNNFLKGEKLVNREKKKIFFQTVTYPEADTGLL